VRSYTLSENATPVVRGAPMAKPRQPRGPPAALGNMRELGAYHLIAYCHRRHQALIDLSKYGETGHRNGVEGSDRHSDWIVVEQTSVRGGLE
jgi:hypothetical protein